MLYIYIYIYVYMCVSIVVCQPNNQVSIMALKKHQVTLKITSLAIQLANS